MTDRIPELLQVLEGAGGGINNYDQRLAGFFADGTIDAAQKSGVVSVTPTTVEKANSEQDTPNWLRILIGVLAVLICLLVVGESLSWWNILPYDDRRGDWNRQN